jgi:hypothetical protein
MDREMRLGRARVARNGETTESHIDQYGEKKDHKFCVEKRRGVNSSDVVGLFNY